MPKKTKPSDTAPLTTTSAIPRGVVINGTAPVLAYNGPVITYGGYLTDPAPLTGSTHLMDPSSLIAFGSPEHRAFAQATWGAAKNSVTPTHTIDSLSTVLDAATQAILTQRADVMPQAVKVAQAALERLLEALQVDHKAKEGAK